MIRRPAPLLAALLLLGCTAPTPAARETTAVANPKSPAGDEEIAIEELEMEDSEALGLLIAGKLAGTATERRAPQTAGVIDASRNWRIGPTECLDRLEAAGVRFHRPAFDTPGVETPLLLDGPIQGVEIEPRWPRAGNVNAVFDCHLVLALVEVARQAAALGLRKVLYFSAYRPGPADPGRCASGAAGSRCRRLAEAYRRSRKGPSQHRAGLAIDIGWLVADDGGWIDLLADFDRRPGVDPCSYEPRDEKARLLQDLACTLYREGIFNVMLTPNANRAHHNHFHFDVTAGADWFILR